MSTETTLSTASPDAKEGSFYRSLVIRRQLILAALTLALGLSLCFDLALGPARYGLGQVITALLTPDAVSEPAVYRLAIMVWDQPISSRIGSTKTENE